MNGMDITALPLVGGHPALDLVNTVEPGTPTPGTRPRDHLADPAALLHWARRVGLVDDARGGARSGRVLAPGGSWAARLAVGGVPDQLVPDRAADAALDVLRGADLARLRRCPPEAGGCGWVFVDRSRNGSRRWCRMADCGSTVKARRLTERRRAARAGRDR